jgi:hypothetical protein
MITKNYSSFDVVAFSYNLVFVPFWRRNSVTPSSISFISSGVEVATAFKSTRTPCP